MMTSEHHGGFAGYMPNPLQAAGWLLEAMADGWAAPCPLLLPLRPPALVAEEMAWLAARYPGRVGLGLAAGSLVDDFEIMGLTKDDLTARFADGLALVAGALGGTDPGRLAADPAVARCREHPGAPGQRGHERRRRAPGRRSRHGHRLRLPLRPRADPGTGRRLPVGRRGRAGHPHPAGLGGVSRRPTRWGGRSTSTGATRRPGPRPTGRPTSWWPGPTPAPWPTSCSTVMARAGADALNLRVHAPGITPEAVREQIGALADVVRRVRAGLSGP